MRRLSRKGVGSKRLFPSGSLTLEWNRSNETDEMPSWLYRLLPTQNAALQSSLSSQGKYYASPTLSSSAQPSTAPYKLKTRHETSYSL